MQKLTIIILISLLCGCDDLNAIVDDLCSNYEHCDEQTLTIQHEIFPEGGDRISPNGWLFRSGNQVTYTSHRPDYEQGYDCEKSWCRKVDSYYESNQWIKDRVTTHTFDLVINKYNQHGGPDWTIIWQDWQRVNLDAEKGPHPITTIKLKPMSNGRVKIGHFENSWQFDYSPTNPIDPSDPHDYNHVHADNTEHGSIILDDDDINEWFRIELTVRDGNTLTSGSVTLKVNGKVISDVSYRTKSMIDEQHISYGMYWTKGYNTEYNYCGQWFIDELSCKSTSITIRDLRIYQ